MAIFIISAIAIICCIGTIIFCRKYVLKAFNSIDAILDRTLEQGSFSHPEITGDDRVSKLTHKASRIMEKYTSQSLQTKEEKGTIQSFISDMSHQMKTPLASITLYTDLLLEGRLESEEKQEFLSRIKSDADKLQWMMDSLIKMSRLEIGAIRLTPTCQNIKQTISDSITSILAVASRKNIDIKVNDFEDRTLFHDKKWTKEVLVNILENAIKYSDSNSTIQISLESLPLYTKVIITDFGIGIKKADWHLIFKRFYRGENAKDIQGAGLGLYLATLIMEKQGGYIMVDSLVNEYTSFILFLQNCGDE